MNSKNSRKNRRRFDRIASPLKIKYTFKGPPSISGMTVLQDVGGGGLSLLLDQNVKKKDFLTVSLYFPEDSRPITALAQVAWCKKMAEKGKNTHKVGLQYFKIVSKDKERFVFNFCELMMNYSLFRKR